MSNYSLVDRLRSLASPFDDREVKTEMELAFPEVQFSHVLYLSGEDIWSMLASLTVCLDAANARLDNMSLRSSGNAYSISCRLSQLSSSTAEAVLGRLKGFSGIHSIHLEHQLGRR